MENFWPHFPIVIPQSPGMPLVWDIFWWFFQVSVMTTLLLVLRRMALRADKARDEAAAEENG